MAIVLTGEATNYGNPASVTIPGTTQVGDVMLMAISVGGNATHLPGTPTGWTQLGSRTESGGAFGSATLWAKAAVSGDIGSTVTFASTGVFQAVNLRTYTCNGRDVEGDTISTANTVGQVALTPAENGELSVCFGCLSQGNGNNDVTFSSDANNQLKSAKQSTMVASFDSNAGASGSSSTAPGTVNALTGGGNAPAWCIFSVLLKSPSGTAYSGSASDSVSVSDSASANEARHGSASDSVSVADSVAGTLHDARGASDSVSVADSASGHHSSTAGASDAVLVSDSAHAGFAGSIRAFDSISVFDSATATGFGAPITDLPTTLALEPATATLELSSERHGLTLDPATTTLAVRDEPTDFRIDGV